MEDFGDSIHVAQNRQGILCAVWLRDISTALAKMRGLEQIMWDIYDRPEWLMQLVTLLQEKIIKYIDQVEQGNGFTYLNHTSQAMSYCKEFIISWRPSPATAVAMGVDEDFVRKEMRTAFEIFDRYHCKFDITLKDIETVSNDKTALIRWVDIVNSEIDRWYR